LKAERNLMMK
jgi:CDP-Glycerol:Poly(glycerophosphate) glycerophosphotransferase